jgi:hypothetical protein
MNPRLLGKPGVGKTTLAYAAGRRAAKTSTSSGDDGHAPEDLLITPVIDREGGIRYVASSLVTAMLRGGVAIVDEGNRMSRSRGRRWPRSSTTGATSSRSSRRQGARASRVRFVATMNDDASTYELPDYIHSRLQPQIQLDFPGSTTRKRRSSREPTVRGRRDPRIRDGFPPGAHEADERYTARDGINIARYALKRLKDASPDRADAKLREAIEHVLGADALRYLS